MGMFKWLKRELRTGANRDRSKSSVVLEQVNPTITTTVTSPQSKLNTNINDLSRDEDYLRKLSKFNEWRSSQVGLKNDQVDKTPNSRRISQADFKTSSESSKQTRYSLDNHHMQYKHLDNFSTPQNRNKNIENIYITDRSQTDPVISTTNCDNRRAEIDVIFNRNFNKSQRRKSTKDSINKQIVESPNCDQIPQAFYERENALPFTSTNDDTYQYVINKHGEVVEYALPYSERSIDAAKRDLSDIVEHEANFDTYSITQSMILDETNIDNQYSSTKKRRKHHDLVTRCGTNSSNGKVAKRLSESNRKHNTKKSHKSKNDVHPDFLDAMEDLMSLGRWSKRQLDTTKTDKNTVEEETFKIKMSMLEPINPSSEFLNCPRIHISCLYIEDEPIFIRHDSILEWRKALWFNEDVFIRSSKPGLMHFQATQTAIAKDVHVLRNVPHKNIALLMALGYDDDNMVVNIMEPFSNTLFQLLHEQPYEVPWNLTKYTEILQQICAACEFLHNRGFIHTNISSHCILIDFAKCQAKLSGFELATSTDRSFKQYYSPNVNNIENLEKCTSSPIKPVRKSLERNLDEECCKKESTNLGRHSSTNKEIRKKSLHKNIDEPSVDCNKNVTSKSKNLESHDAWDFVVWGEEQHLSDRRIFASYQWQAPELFDNFNTTVVRPCIGSDVYSLSLVLLECCTGVAPWNNVSMQDLAAKYKSMEGIDVPGDIDNNFKTLIIRGTKLDPKVRILTVKDFMHGISNEKNVDQDSGEIIYQNSNFGSHSRLRKILINEAQRMDTDTTDMVCDQETYNIDDCMDKTQDSIDIKQSKMEQFYSDLNAYKIEFTEEEVYRMTGAEFLRELEYETEKFKLQNKLKSQEQNNTSYNIFSSPLVNETTNYYSTNEKSILDTENNTTSRSNRLLLNITPKFYTPLHIQTPVTDLSITNYNNNAKSQDSVYSFDIEDYELPDTPIARNTKIRKNAWLSEPKQNKYRKNNNQSFNESRILNETRDISDAYVTRDICNEVEQLRNEINKTYDNILDKVVQDKNNQSPNCEQQSEEIFYTPEVNFTSTPENESARAIRRRERLNRINNVKSKLNDILSKSLNCAPNCLNVSPAKLGPHSASFSYAVAQKEKLQPSPVKPASHSTETTFALLNQNVPAKFSSKTFPNLSPPYNSDAIKPASHQDECNIIHKEKDSGNQSPTEMDSPKATKLIESQLVINNRFEALWKMEKNKCEQKQAPSIEESRLVNSATQTTRNDLKSSRLNKTFVCDSAESVSENYLQIHEKSSTDNFDANVVSKVNLDDKTFNINDMKLKHDNITIVINNKNVNNQKINLICDKKKTEDKETGNDVQENIKEIQENVKNSSVNNDNFDTNQKSHLPKLTSSDEILQCADEFKELFIDEAKISSDNETESVNDNVKENKDQFSECYIPLTDFSRYTTLPNKISTRIYVTPERGFFSQICRKESASSNSRRVSVLEIAKIFEKHPKESVTKFSMDSSLARKSRQMCFANNVKEFEKVNCDKTKDFGISSCSIKTNEDEFLKSNKSSELPEFGKGLDQSFIYNNALEEKDEDDAKVCTHCGSGISPAIAPTPHRLTLSPDLAEICANLLKDQFSDLESRYMINTAFGLTQNSNSLRRCQTLAAIQDARSIEDLYIDDEFTTEDQLGSHMQLYSCRTDNNSDNCSSTASIADSFDIYYRENDFYPEINLEEYPLSIDLPENDDGEEDATSEKDYSARETVEEYNFCPTYGLTQILEENSDCESEGKVRNYSDGDEVMESSL